MQAWLGRAYRGPFPVGAGGTDLPIGGLVAGKNTSHFGVERGNLLPVQGRAVVPLPVL